MGLALKPFKTELFWGNKNIQNTTIYARFITGTRDARARKMFSSQQWK